MANKRMFNRSITESDAFLDMPTSTQALYFHLNLNADDEGFVNAPNKVARNCGAAKDDLNLLLLKNFIIAFDNGIIVIKHWRLHNWIRGDRVKATTYTDQREELEIDKNGSYTIGKKLKEIEAAYNCQTNVRQMSDNSPPNGSIDKSSIDKNRLDKNRVVVEEIEDTTAAAARETLKEIIKVYEEEIGLITPTIAEEIEAFLEELPADMITRAIKEASMHNVKAWKYIASILNRCVNQGIKNEAEFDKKKTKTKSKPSIKKTTPARPNKYEGIYQN